MIPYQLESLSHTSSDVCLVLEKSSEYISIWGTLLNLVMHWDPAQGPSIQ